MCGGRVTTALVVILSRRTWKPLRRPSVRRWDTVGAAHDIFRRRFAPTRETWTNVVVGAFVNAWDGLLAEVSHAHHKTQRRGA
jgi:dihydrofolate reductase